MTGCFFFSVQVNAPLIRGFLVGVGGGGLYKMAVYSIPLGVKTCNKWLATHETENW